MVGGEESKDVCYDKIALWDAALQADNQPGLEIKMVEGDFDVSFMHSPDVTSCAKNSLVYLSLWQSTSFTAGFIVHPSVPGLPWVISISDCVEGGKVHSQYIKHLHQKEGRRKLLLLIFRLSWVSWLRREGNNGCWFLFHRTHLRILIFIFLVRPWNIYIITYIITYI